MSASLQSWCGPFQADEKRGRVGLAPVSWRLLVPHFFLRPHPGWVPSLLSLLPSVQTGVDVRSSQHGWKTDEVMHEECSEGLMLLGIYQKMMDVLNKQPTERWQPQVHLTCHSTSLRGSLLPL